MVESHNPEPQRNLLNEGNQTRPNLVEKITDEQGNQRNMIEVGKLDQYIDEKVEAALQARLGEALDNRGIKDLPQGEEILTAPKRVRHAMKAFGEELSRKKGETPHEKKAYIKGRISELDEKENLSLAEQYERLGLNLQLTGESKFPPGPHNALVFLGTVCALIGLHEGYQAIQSGKEVGLDIQQLNNALQNIDLLYPNGWKLKLPDPKAYWNAINVASQELALDVGDTARHTLNVLGAAGGVAVTYYAERLNKLARIPGIAIEKTAKPIQTVRNLLKK